jgi:hypothetical protein
MKPGRVRLVLLAVDIAAIAAIVGIFVWGLVGTHRFPTEAAIYVAVMVALLISNAVYIWRHPRGRPD